MKETKSRWLIKREWMSWTEYVQDARSQWAEWEEDVQLGSAEWRGVSTTAELETLLADGWPDGVQSASQIAHDALELIDQDVSQTVYQADWLLAGSEVDVGRFLSGVPECMIEYQPFQVSKVGKVITLCASIGANGSFSADQLVRRGAALVGLVMALEESQHSVELWLDSTVLFKGRGKGNVAQFRVLLKGANDTLNVSDVVMALGHPASLRVITFCQRMNLDSTFTKGQCARFGGGMGASQDPIKDLPDGTIYLPALTFERYGADVIGDEWIRQTLTQLGLIGKD